MKKVFTVLAVAAGTDPINGASSRYATKEQAVDQPGYRADAQKAKHS